MQPVGIGPFGGLIKFTVVGDQKKPSWVRYLVGRYLIGIGVGKQRWAFDGPEGGGEMLYLF